MWPRLGHSGRPSYSSSVSFAPRLAPIQLRDRQKNFSVPPLIFSSKRQMSARAPPPCRFPPPWSVEETAPCFIVRDANGQALAFVYCEDEPGRRATGKLLTRDEARRIAANIAKLPGLLRPHT
jgi:hypothetical protein